MADASKDAPEAASHEVKPAEPAKEPSANSERKPAAAATVAKKEPGPDSCTGIVYAHSNKATGMAIKKDVRVKAPGKRELLIKVFAASINPVDYKLNSMPVIGLFQEGKTVGLDFCGEVLKVGYKVQNFKVGDHVYGFGNGSLAEYCIAEEAKVALKPTKLDFKDAACLPVVAVTTYQALKRNGVKEGSRLLVIGASGGCGLMGVQMGKGLGAHVVGVCSGKNAALVRTAGADEVIDYTQAELPKALLAGGDKFFPGGERFDVIYDTVSSSDPVDHRYEPEVRQFLKPGTGRYVTINGATGDALMGLLRTGIGLDLQRSGFDLVMCAPNSADLKAVADLVDEGKIKPVIAAVHTMDEEGLKAGFEQLKSRRTAGKIVYVPPVSPPKDDTPAAATAAAADAAADAAPAPA